VQRIFVILFFGFCLVHCFVQVSATDPRQPVIGFLFYLTVNLYYLQILLLDPLSIYLKNRGGRLLEIKMYLDCKEYKVILDLFSSMLVGDES